MSNKSCKDSNKFKYQPPSSSSVFFQMKIFKHSVCKELTKFKRQLKSFKVHKNISKLEFKPLSKIRTLQSMMAWTTQPQNKSHQTKSLTAQASTASREQNKKCTRSWKTTLRSSGSQLVYSVRRTSKICRACTTFADPCRSQICKNRLITWGEWWIGTWGINSHKLMSYSRCRKILRTELTFRPMLPLLGDKAITNNNTNKKMKRFKQMISTMNKMKTSTWIETEATNIKTWATCSDQILCNEFLIWIVHKELFCNKRKLIK